MPEFQIPYGRTKLSVRLGGSLQVELLAPKPVAPLADPLLAVRQALSQPLGNVRLADFAKARSVAIAINDKTRPVPHSVLLPPLLEELQRLGVPAEAITFVVATGLHAFAAERRLLHYCRVSGAELVVVSLDSPLETFNARNLRQVGEYVGLPVSFRVT